MSSERYGAVNHSTYPSELSIESQSVSSSANLLTSENSNDSNYKKKIVRFVLSLVVVFAVVMERTSFKLMVDEYPSYRFILMQLVLLFYIMFSSLCTSFRALNERSLSRDFFYLPMFDVFKIAVLESIQMILMYISASKVEPFFIVVLIQPSLCLSPLFAFRKLTPSQAKGTFLLIVGILASMLPLLLYSESYPKSVICCFVYFLSVFPAALAECLKEKMICTHEIAIDPKNFNLAVCLFQLFFVLLCSPFIYKFQWLGSSWNSYPEINSFWDAFREGWECILGGKPSVCSSFLGLQLALIHTISAISLGVCLEYIVSKGDSLNQSLKLAHISLNFGIFVAVLFLLGYSWSDWDRASFQSWGQIASVFVGSFFVLCGVVMFRRVEGDVAGILTTANRKYHHVKLSHQISEDTNGS